MLSKLAEPLEFIPPGSLLKSIFILYQLTLFFNFFTGKSAKHKSMDIQVLSLRDFPLELRLMTFLEMDHMVDQVKLKQLGVILVIQLLRMHAKDTLKTLYAIPGMVWQLIKAFTIFFVQILGEALVVHAASSSMCTLSIISFYEATPWLHLHISANTSYNLSDVVNCILLFSLGLRPKDILLNLLAVVKLLPPCLLCTRMVAASRMVIVELKEELESTGEKDTPGKAHTVNVG